jgi:UPF0716 protein FxsA
VLGRLLLLFTLVPFLELILLIWLGERVGLVPTVALVLATGVVGAALARHQGLATWDRFQSALAAGRLPGRELLEGFLVLIAGAFLVTPGILTDTAGFLLLLPTARRWLMRRFEVRLRARMVVTGAPAASPGPGVIDAEFEVHDDDGPRG